MEGWSLTKRDIDRPPFDATGEALGSSDAPAEVLPSVAVRAPLLGPSPSVWVSPRSMRHTSKSDIADSGNSGPLRPHSPTGAGHLLATIAGAPGYPPRACEVLRSWGRAAVASSR